MSELLIIRCDNCYAQARTAEFSRDPGRVSSIATPPTPPGWSRGRIPPSTEQGDLCPDCTAVVVREATNALTERQKLRPTAADVRVATPDAEPVEPTP